MPSPSSSTVQEEHSRAVRRQLSGELLRRQQHRRGAVREHARQAFGGITGIERHIGAAGLEDTQQAGDHRRRTLDEEAHGHFRSHPRPAQAAGQPLRPVVELAIGQLAVLGDDGGKVGGPRSLGLEQLVQTVLLGQGQVGRVPLPRHLPALGRRQEGQLGQTAGRLGRRRFTG